MKAIRRILLPSRLDSHIPAAGNELARKVGGRLHAMHASFPSAIAFATGDPAFDSVAIDLVVRRQKESSAKSITALAARARTPPARRHFVEADAVTAIPAIARGLGADLVIMGAVSRSGLSRCRSERRIRAARA